MVSVDKAGALMTRVLSMQREWSMRLVAVQKCRKVELPAEKKPIREGLKTLKTLNMFPDFQNA